MCSIKAYIFGCVQRPIRQKYIIQIFALLTKILPPFISLQMHFIGWNFYLKNSVLLNPVVQLLAT